MVPNSPTITWIKNLFTKNIRGAWESNRIGTDLPMAIHATYIHPRMYAQKSCFTINGMDEQGFMKVITNDNVIQGIQIDSGQVTEIIKQLREMGITHGAVPPKNSVLLESQQVTHILSLLLQAPIYLSFTNTPSK